MYLSKFAQGLEPEDLTRTEAFQSLLSNAAKHGVEVTSRISCHSRNIVARGLRFHLLEWGEPSNPPMLMLHGGNVSAHHWDMVNLELSRRFHIFALDQRGHGDSEWPRDWDIRISSMVEDVIAVMAVLGLKRPTIVGHSMGGRVAMTLLSQSDLASSLVLVDIGPELGGPLPADAGEPERVWQFPSMEAYINSVRSSSSAGRSPAQIMITAGHNLLLRSDGVLVSKSLRRSGARTPYKVERAGVATLDDLARIKCPVLLIRGESSHILSEGVAEACSEKLARGEVATVTAGHNVHTENPRGFLEAVTPFLLAANP